jgi:hypothetical protein
LRVSFFLEKKYMTQARAEDSLLATRRLDDMKSKEEKVRAFQDADAELRAKATQAGHGEPFISWVIDPNGGLLLLDFQGAVDTSSAPSLSWDADRFFVFVFSETRRSFFSTALHFGS